MKPIPFPEHNAVLAKDQPQYMPLPVWRERPGEVPALDYKGQVVSCWQLTWRERFALLWSGKLWLSQLTFGHPLQPQLPTVANPFLVQL